MTLTFNNKETNNVTFNGEKGCKGYLERDNNCLAKIFIPTYKFGVKGE